METEDNNVVFLVTLDLANGARHFTRMHAFVIAARVINGKKLKQKTNLSSQALLWTGRQSAHFCLVVFQEKGVCELSCCSLSHFVLY